MILIFRFLLYIILFFEVKNFCYVINFYDLSKFISFLYKHTVSSSLCEVLPYDYCCCQTKGNLHKMQTVASKFNSIERKILTIFNEEIFLFVPHRHLALRSPP